MSGAGKKITRKVEPDSYFAVNRTHIIPGYGNGLRQPSLLADIGINANLDFLSLADSLRSLVKPHIPPEKEEVRPDNSENRFTPLEVFFAEFSVIVAGIQEAAGIPVLEKARFIVKPKRNGAFLATLILPSLIPRAVPLVLQWVLALAESVISKPQAQLNSQQEESLELLLKKLIPNAPQGSNNIRFIRAAHGLDIPFIPLPGDIFQYGWGVNSKRFKSSLTDETNSIAVFQARDKFVTLKTLSMAGHPVPNYARVMSEEGAIETASKIGYPVAIKPTNLDKGMGVTANIKDEEQLRTAYKLARAESPFVHIEKHIQGESYRISVFRGRTTVVSLRIPAGITGDGKSTVEELISQVNCDPRRSSSRFSIMKPLTIDDEALTLLAESGMDLNSIPKEGNFTALKRAANVSTGGDVINLDVEKDVHPSYRSLAERVTSLMRLDISGIDLITPDITKNCHEVGGAIIEVNAQPQMGSTLTHLHGELLQQYVEGRGLIPSAILLGSSTKSLFEGVQNFLETRSFCAGGVYQGGTYVSGEKRAEWGENLSGAVTSLLIDPEVESVLISTSGDSICKQGVPLPCFDTLILDSQHSNEQALKASLSILQPYLETRVLVEASNPYLKLAYELFGRDRVILVQNRDELVDVAGDGLLSSPVLRGE